MGTTDLFINRMPPPIILLGQYEVVPARTEFRKGGNCLRKPSANGVSSSPFAAITLCHTTHKVTSTLPNPLKKITPLTDILTRKRRRQDTIDPCRALSSELLQRDKIQHLLLSERKNTQQSNDGAIRKAIQMRGCCRKEEIIRVG